MKFFSQFIIILVVAVFLLFGIIKEENTVSSSISSSVENLEISEVKAKSFTINGRKIKAMNAKENGENKIILYITFYE